MKKAESKRMMNLRMTHRYSVKYKYFNCHRLVGEAVQYKKFSRSLLSERENKGISGDNLCNLSIDQLTDVSNGF